MGKSESRSKRFVNSLVDTGLYFASTSTNSRGSCSTSNQHTGITGTAVETSSYKTESGFPHQTVSEASQSDKTKTKLVESSLKYILRETVDSYSEKMVSTIYSSTVNPIRRGAAT